MDVITVDALVDGVHFDRRRSPPEAIGHRALAVNLSDLAAMGAEPRSALLSMLLPGDLPLSDFDGIVQGFCALAAHHRVQLLGGNLTRTPGPLALDVTATGSVKRRDVLTRAGAAAGDEVYVTGTVGAAAAGLETVASRQSSVVSQAVDRYLRPEPRVRMGVVLARNRAATACVDLSDGLADGAHRIAEASGVGMVIDGTTLPVDAAASAWWQASGGDALMRSLVSDDYELLFTARPRLRGRLAAARGQGGTPVTRIGYCTREPAVVLRTARGDIPMPAGYAHFGAAAPERLDRSGAVR